MNDIIENFRTVIEEIAQEKGELEFAGLIEREQAPEKLDIVIAANWISNEREFLDYLVAKLKRFFSDKEFVQLGRIVVLNPRGEFLQEYNRIIGPLLKDQEVSNMRIADAFVRWGHLFAITKTPQTVLSR